MNDLPKAFLDLAPSKSSTNPLGFFAYPASPPMIPATIRAAIEALNATDNVLIYSWEDLKVEGKYIISEVLKAIDDCDFFCADLTGINPNVMFELGYAIAKNKRTWIIRVESYSEAKKDYEQLKILTTVGYRLYAGSAQIIDGFFKDSPFLDLNNTIFNNSIEPSLGSQSNEPQVLYLKNRHDTDASIRVTRALEDSHIPLKISDPNESSMQPLYWYAQELWNSAGLVAHFISSAREGFKLHNARYALVSGLAAGLHVNTLMLSEHSDVLAPMDYRDAFRFYSVPKEAFELTEEWLQPVLLKSHRTFDINANHASSVRKATELKDFHLRLGDYVAENESVRLNDYFVETTVSDDIANGTQTVFVGRKGTGKSANLIHAEATIGREAGNLVCLIKPVGYEIAGLVRLFGEYKLQDHKGYVIESLWKYMLYTELAIAAAKQIGENALWQMNDADVQELVNTLEDRGNAFEGDFAVRLERIIKKIAQVDADGPAEEFRKGISESIHSQSLGKLRLALGKVLSRKNKVLLLIDNLDKPWTKTADLKQLAEFLKGLLTAAERVGLELSRAEKDRKSVVFNSAIFMRSDIFEKVIDVTLEPDKLSFTRMRWEDPELLLRIIEERYVASHGDKSDPATMWKKYFCSTVQGMPTRHYLTQRILQRPRDIVYLVKAAVAFAVNRKRDRVEEKDIADGERQYSQYALDSILVENVGEFPEMEPFIFELAGSTSILSRAEIEKTALKCGVTEDRVNDLVEHLTKLSFLGVEIEASQFAFSEETRELRLNRVMSARFRERSGQEQRFEINKPFRAYLKVEEYSS